MRKVPAENFYGEYHGHKVRDLRTVLQLACAERPRLWLLGDSTLDNKYWVGPETAGAANGYDAALEPALSRPDVCHVLNGLLERRGGTTVAVNCAVEESTLGGRADGLMPQDELMRELVSSQDTVVVSVGGNDVALKPTFATGLSVLAAVMLNGGEVPGPHGWGVPHLVRLFGAQVEQYVRDVLGDTRPRAVVFCMLYFPDENAAEQCWAGSVLAALGYNRAPQRLQNVMRAVYEHAVKKIDIEGAKVVHCPLFKVLDGKDSTKYVARVEPSASGGVAMAEFILSCLDKAGVKL